MSFGRKRNQTYFLIPSCTVETHTHTHDPNSVWNANGVLNLSVAAAGSKTRR